MAACSGDVLFLLWLTRMPTGNFVCCCGPCFRSYLSNYSCTSYCLYFISYFLFFFFPHRVFNDTGHGTVAPLTRPSAEFAETSPALRPSPLLAPLPPPPLLQGSASVHLVSFPSLRLSHFAFLTCTFYWCVPSVSVAVNRTQ